MNGHSNTKVTIGNEDNEVGIILQEKVEEALMEDNNERSLLTYRTPLMQEDRLHNDIEFLGDIPNSDDILNGKYDYPKGTDIVIKWTVPHSGYAYHGRRIY